MNDEFQPSNHATGVLTPDSAESRSDSAPRGRTAAPRITWPPGRLVNANTGAPIAVFRDGMWRGPQMDEETKAKRFGGAA